MLYTYFFFAKKKGYDSDEVWSYALSNSYYRPFLETTAGWNMAYTKEDTHYISEWFNGSVYHDYITVQKGQQFSYDSVWYNQANDVHPPLYYAIIHTICSFSPDIYSPWFALSVNYAAFILVMLLLFWLCFYYSDSVKNGAALPLLLSHVLSMLLAAVLPTLIRFSVCMDYAPYGQRCCFTYCMATFQNLLEKFLSCWVW